MPFAGANFPSARHPYKHHRSVQFMSNSSQPSKWDLLASLLGAKPAAETPPPQRTAPAVPPPAPKRAPAAAPTRKPAAGDWDNWPACWGFLRSDCTSAPACPPRHPATIKAGSACRADPHRNRAGVQLRRRIRSPIVRSAARKAGPAGRDRPQRAPSQSPGCKGRRTKSYRFSRASRCDSESRPNRPRRLKRRRGRDPPSRSGRCDDAAYRT